MIGHRPSLYHVREHLGTRVMAVVVHTDGERGVPRHNSPTQHFIEHLHGMPKVAAGRVRGHEGVRHIHHPTRKDVLDDLRVGAGDEREAARSKTRECLEDVRERVGIQVKAPTVEGSGEEASGGRRRLKRLSDGDGMGWRGEGDGRKKVGGATGAAK